MDIGFLNKLDKARAYSSMAYEITSGYRCPSYNLTIGGVPDSAHVHGYAADIRVRNSTHRYQILRGMFKLGFHRIGIGDGFIHVDSDHNKPSYLVWEYYKKG